MVFQILPESGSSGGSYVSSSSSKYGWASRSLEHCGQRHQRSRKFSDRNMSPVPRSTDEEDRIRCAVGLRGGARQTLEEFRGLFAGGSESVIGEPGLLVAGAGTTSDSSSTSTLTGSPGVSLRIFQGAFSWSRVIIETPGVPAYRVRRGIECTHEPHMNDS
jgi:hypothetical protein